MNDSILTLDILKRVRENILKVARREYKENRFIFFNGKRYGKTQLSKEVTEGITPYAESDGE